MQVPGWAVPTDGAQGWRPLRSSGPPVPDEGGSCSSHTPTYLPSSVTTTPEAGTKLTLTVGGPPGAVIWSVRAALGQGALGFGAFPVLESQKAWRLWGVWSTLGPNQPH